MRSRLSKDPISKDPILEVYQYHEKVPVGVISEYSKFSYRVKT